jgi:D-beta-D-heptose 7-phosphate kinase / D-beta-D-heptose 1-phosphate adenosyltransferase
MPVTTPPNTILLIGEVCTDETIGCSVERISPEAPIPIAKPLKERHLFNLGMAGNVRANLVSLGHPDERIISYTNKPSAVNKLRYVDEASGYMLLRVDTEAPISPIRTDGDGVFLDEYAGISSLNWDRIAALVISDYDKGLLGRSTIRHLLHLAATKRIPSFMDTKKILDGDWSKQCDYIKINWKEYQAQLKGGVGAPQTKCKNLIVTKGSEGIWWANKDVLYPVEKVGVINSCGAGDTTLAAFVIEYLRSQSTIEAIKYANKAARIAVSKRGVVAVSAAEVK